MKLKILQEIIKKKNSKTEFAIVTNLKDGDSEIFEKGKKLSKNFESYQDQIEIFFKTKKNGVIENTEIFVETYIRPIKVIIVGAVHIAQYLVDFAKSLNFEISIIDPRGYFASEQRFPDLKIINKWPDEAFKEIVTNENWPTITKTRCVDNRTNYIIVRIDNNEDDYGRCAVEDIEYTKYDVVVISDYNKGFLTEEDISYITKNHSTTFLDTKKMYFL